MTFTIRELDSATWDAFAELVERNNGIFGGCWCIGYHPECGQKGISHRAAKEDRVRTGRAHAALVIDEDGAAQGWCQYGSPEELPNIKHKRKYDQDAPPLPDWRITCFYVDRKHRGQGIARAALEGALDQIAKLGGGLTCGFAYGLFASSCISLDRPAAQARPKATRRWRLLSLRRCLRMDRGSVCVPPGFAG